MRPIVRIQADATQGRVQDAIARLAGQRGHFGIGRRRIDAGHDRQVDNVLITLRVMYFATRSVVSMNSITRSVMST